LDEVLGSPQVLEGLDLALSQHPQVLEGVTFGAVEVAGDEEGNEPNAMVWIEADGMRMLHMGDCGHQPTPAQVAACGRVDVLLALAGGAPTLSIESLLNFIEALQPRVVIPMHFGAAGLKTMKLLPIDDLEEGFYARFGPASVVEATESTLNLTPANLPHTPLMMCLPSAR
jgi:L-ascorbate metabolism protein UlaG (beta-lactamase superfamily)